MKIRIIKGDGTSRLIEWQDEEGTHRGTVPTNLLSSDVLIKDEYLSMAIPYGVDWAFSLEDAIRPVTASDLAQSLRNHGIWTLADAKRNPGAVQGAILSAYGVTFQTIMRVAEQYTSNGGSVNG